MPVHRYGFDYVMVIKQLFVINNILSHNWLLKGKLGGHIGSFSIFETAELKNAYSSALCKIDATDTLVAVAEI